jgi:hypothetical protein
MLKRKGIRIALILVLIGVIITGYAGLCGKSTNGGSTSGGSDRGTFTFVTDPADNPTQTSATLNGRINPNGISTSAYFRYSTTSACSNSTLPQSKGAGTSEVVVTAPVTGLSGNTLYYFKLVAIRGGTTYYGSTLTFMTKEPNRAPVLAAIGNQSVNEGATLTFTISATDPDNDTITYSASNVPPGANFNATTRTFSWTPDYTQANTYNVTFRATDTGSLYDEEQITITVNNVNRMPILTTPIGNKTGNEGALLSFSVPATDPDGDNLTYSITNKPTNATFNTTTGAFSWTPNYDEAGSYPNINFKATDTGSLFVQETITITINNTNRAPVLDPIGNKSVAVSTPINFTISASDPDVGDTLTYSVISTSPTANFNPGTRQFSWTPGTTGNYNFTFTVTDNGTPNRSTSEMITISVGNVNHPPVLAAIGNQTVNEGITLSFVITSTDPDVGDTLTYSTSTLPSGANFNAGTRTFSWTPDYTQANTYLITFTVTDNGTPNLSDFEQITITVNNVNRAPVLAAIGNQSVNEGATLTFTVSAADADGGDTLTYSTSTLPSGATFNATTRTFSWTPDYTQANTYLITFTVTDNGTPNLSDFEQITVTVNNVNRAPVLDAVGNKNVNENATLIFTVSAADADGGDTLTYSTSSLPSGATFNATTRTFSWTPDYTQANTYPITFTVTDNGTPNLSDFEQITVTVNNVNRAPVLDAIGDRNVEEGVLLTFTINATDPDVGDALTYSITNKPTNATFDTGTRVFSWTPNYSQGGTSYPNVTFTATDNGSPNLSDSKAITITVTNIPAPTVTTTAASNIGSAYVTLNGTVNPNGRNVTPCYFEYGISPSYTTTITVTALPGSGTSAVPVSATKSSGLTASSVYQFRVVATSAAGTSTGSQQIFVTKDTYDPTDDTGAGGTWIYPVYNSTYSHGPHSLSSADNYDWYQISMVSSYQYYFSTTTTYGIGSAAGTVGELYYDSAGTTLKASNNPGGGNFNLTVSYPASQTYYLRVRTNTVGSNWTGSLTYRYTY